VQSLSWITDHLLEISMGHEASAFMITLFCLISSVQEREGKEI
jgi:hypothetical protein